MNQYKQKLKRAAQNISLAIMFGISCLITAHAADFSITVKTKTIKGDQYNNVATKSITGDHWELISGHYKHSNDKDLASPYLYIEGPNKGINYYIDSLVVVDLNSELSGSAENLTDNADLETGSVSPWFKNGDVKLALESAIVNDGKYSLKVSQRTDNWNGAAIAFNRALISGHTYKISAWVKLAKSEATVKTVQKSNPSSVNSNYVYFTDGKPTGEWGIVLGDSSDWTKGIKNNTGSSADKQLAVKPATYKVANDAINIKWARKKARGSLRFTVQTLIYLRCKIQWL
ncbi:carbohydrate binding domain-containing protein [Psychrosphaera algicola]|uniref:Carbohydrate binding domain-containing protein n=1 Tax=Psychrosphaera algicola TaxID=3023714 RepID=A0ABT5FIN4_9GAMM|nr:carbohydrate binding domain-containing protein [Psychrosphaera sp. G1-22]MDC2891057.1 carbohydrate binding domain-containing protein [Psychrosphaera sp. G1-22]